eukprot:scaffold1435_cov267-Pinguiococcus_pyrenoidosus.AAC.43
MTDPLAAPLAAAVAFRVLVCLRRGAYFVKAICESLSSTRERYVNFVNEIVSTGHGPDRALLLLGRGRVALLVGH